MSVLHPMTAAAIQHFTADRLDLAEEMARRAHAAAPEQPDSLNLLAVIACRRGDLDSGIELALKVLADHPDDAQALELLGDALHSLEEYEGAAEAFRRAVAVQPNERRLHAKHGYALHEAGTLEAAIEAYTRAIALGGAAPELYLDLGRALALLRRPEDAVKAFRQAVAIDPDCGMGWNYLAEMLGARGEIEEACAAYRHALYTLPDDADCHFNLARLLNDLGRFDEALAAGDRAVALRPDFVEAHSNRSAVLRQLGRFPDAAEAARRALAINPNHANALSNLGNALTALGKLDTALTAHIRAVELAPERGNILANLALTLQELGEEADAITVLERAVALDPSKAWPQFNLALIRLKNGDFARGWQGYDWRWKARNRGAREDDRRTPRWDGHLLRQGRLMIWSEQGIGDEIMFAGFLPQLVQSGISCAVECDQRLVPVFRRSFPDVVVIARGSTEPLPADIAAHIHAGDLPGLLRPDRRPSPWFTPGYLCPDPDRRAGLRRRYGGGKPLVGIAWYSANQLTGARRSIAIETLRPLLRRTDVTWVSLQYGDLSAVAHKFDGRLTIDPEIDQMTDMDRFAAQVAAMDLVVTIDNSTAHLAGALGRPTLLALSYDADWRWMRERSDTPWYRDLHLVRQPAPGDWRRVIDAVSDAIDTHLPVRRVQAAAS